MSTTTGTGAESDREQVMYRDELSYQRALMEAKGEDGMPSCMSLMDDFLMCFCASTLFDSHSFAFAVRVLTPSCVSTKALGSQATHLFTHSAPRSCAQKGDLFKFCLSLKGESESTKRELFMKRKAELWTKKRLEGSSEDVWEVRGRET